MKEEKHIITGCIDCPFSYEYDMSVGHGCKLDDQKRKIMRSKKHGPITPDWCEARKHDIIVKYEGCKGVNGITDYGYNGVRTDKP